MFDILVFHLILFLVSRRRCLYFLYVFSKVHVYFKCLCMYLYFVYLIEFCVFSRFFTLLTSLQGRFSFRGSPKVALFISEYQSGHDTRLPPGSLAGPSSLRYLQVIVRR